MGNILGVYGEVEAVYNSIIIIGISIVFLIVGIIIVNMPIKNKVAVGTVVKILQNGVAKISYHVDGQTYILSQSNSYSDQNSHYRVSTTNNYTVGDTVNVLYSENNPADGRLSTSFSSRWMGWIFIVLSIIAIIGTIFNTFMVMRNKNVAEVEGGMDIAQGILKYI